MTDPREMTRHDLESEIRTLRNKVEEQRLTILDLKNTKTRQLDEIISLRTELSHKKTEYNDLYRYVFGEKRDWLDKIFGKTCWIYNKRHHIQR